MLLSNIQPAAPFIIPDVHPHHVYEYISKVFPHVRWEYVTFDDNDEDYMLVVSYKKGISEKGAVCAEIRTGQPIVFRPLTKKEALRW